MADKVAVVTGSNKGIGFVIVKRLSKRGVGIVYLTARDVTRGEEAIEKLNHEGLNPKFHQLDVTDKESVKALANYLKQKHGGLDILINNAAITVSNMTNTIYEDAEKVINTNYKSILTVQEYLFPLLKDNARVINISSDCGHISNIKNPEWIKILTKDDVTLEDVNSFVDWFLNSVRENKLNEQDFGESTILAYRISKVALCALTRVQQRQVKRGISVNSIHPGFVKTDMTKGHGFLHLDESGEAPVYLALDADQSVKGKYFWFDKTEKDWADSKQDLYPKVKDFVHLLQGQI